jgi:putative transposase
LYNAALEERIDCYRKTGKGLTFVDQTLSLTICRRELPEMANFSVALQRWTLKRLDEAFAGFYRRVKARRGKAGFPRFKGRDGWNSFGLASTVQFVGKRIRFKGMATGLRVHFHRPLPKKHRIYSCILRREERGWVVCFGLEIDAEAKRAVADALGIDLGLKVFAYCSDGVVLPNPRVARKAERKMRVAQRALARCRRHSNRRRKARARVARIYRKISNTRATWLHQQAAALIKRTDLVAVEDLRINGMMRCSTVARSIADASWAKFLGYLEYKAERAGVHFVRVDPRNTSQKCSGCGALVFKSLAMRTHACTECGLVIDRDWNAARNILQAGIGLGVHNVIQVG